jgi:hypothetical protein
MLAFGTDSRTRLYVIMKFLRPDRADVQYLSARQPLHRMSSVFSLGCICEWKRGENLDSDELVWEEARVYDVCGLSRYRTQLFDFIVLDRW